MALSPKQQRFIEEYLIDLNATAAAERAGYKTPRISGSENMTKPAIAAEIKKRVAERSERTRITADAVLNELALLGFSDIGNVIDFTGTDPKLRPANEISQAARKTLASVKVRRHLEGSADSAREVEVIEFKMWDKISALHKLGQHLGMFKDKAETGGGPNGPIQVVGIKVIINQKGTDAGTSGPVI